MNKTLQGSFFLILFVLISNIIHPEFLKLTGKEISFSLDDQSGAFYADNLSPSTRNGQQYLFKDLPPTSFITVIANGKPYQISETGILSNKKPFQWDGNKIVRAFKIDTLAFKLMFMITNLDGRGFNSIICLLKVKNEGPDQSLTGARFLFDTCFGEAEKRPSLYLSSKERVEYDRMWTRENLPQFIFSGVFEGDINEFGKGLFIYPSINELRPEKVIIGNWKKFYEKDLAYELTPLARFKYNSFANPDAAAAVYFNNIYIKSGEEVSFGTLLSTTKLPPVFLKLSEAVTEMNFYDNKNVIGTATQSGQPDLSMTGTDAATLKSQIGLLEKMTSLIDKLDIYLSNNYKDGSSLQKGLEKSVVKSAYGDPFDNAPESREKKTGIKGAQTNAVFILPSYIYTNGDETNENIDRLKKDVGRLQKLYDDKIASIKKYYEDLLKKQEKEFKQISGGYKEKINEREMKKNKSKKIGDVNDTIIQIDKKIGVIEELLKLNLDFEGMPPEKLGDMEKRINDIEVKLR